MQKRALTVVFCLLVASILGSFQIYAQDLSGQWDTFFLNKKRGLLGKLGKSISADRPGPDPIRIANPFMAFNGKTIRFIEILSLGFERNIYDTSIIKNSIGVIIANAFHKNTRSKILVNNLFFREGSRIQPYLLADNERHLREQVYIQDARIIVVNVSGSTDLVDVFVITKDVFSVGGKLNISGVRKSTIGIREENFGGSGSKLEISTFYEKDRKPVLGYGFELIKRNIRGSFIDWKIGYQNYKGAFNSGRAEETQFYTQFVKPLVSPYIPWIGQIDFSVNNTSNLYLKDSIYKSDFKYRYINADGWFGYNFGSHRLMYSNIESRLRKLLAVRAMKVRFHDLPEQSNLTYDFRYADISSVLLAFNVFKQNFYRTNFIYGFGRNEDVPEGFTASIITGFTKKNELKRPYYGADFLLSNFNKRGFYSTYTFKFGGYRNNQNFEDIDLLMNVDHFTKLVKMGSKWLNRNFYSVGFTRQMNKRLNQPLLLRSDFGLPYINNGLIAAEFRGTIKGESVFFNMNKILGFRMAPFFFGDMSMITPVNKSFKKSELYSALGAGIRTRNENLIFGTVELKGFFFPRTVEGMKRFRVELNSNIRFKYNSTLIRKPDFIVPN